MDNKSIKIMCPAKINLTLKVLNKREDGFHNIESIMQTINLFDYLTITVEQSSSFSVKLSGTSNEIPYDKSNIVYKACLLFAERTNLSAHKIDIFIEKHIPVAAGLAGGSTDAAGTFYGLNALFNKPLNRDELHELCAKLGSDLNFCLEGGRQKTTGRGEVLENLPFEEFSVSLIKPLNLGISAKEAYTKFSKKQAYTDELRTNFVNDLEWGLIDDYKELRQIKTRYPEAVMSGSGSTYFVCGQEFENEEGYWIKNNLHSVPYGVKSYMD